MFTGRWKYKLVYNKPCDLSQVIQEYYNRLDAYNVLDIGLDEYFQPGEKECWVCSGVDCNYMTAYL